MCVVGVKPSLQAAAVWLAVCGPALAEPGDADKPPPTATAETISIVVAGDTGFARNGARPDPRGVHKHGTLQPWPQSTEGIAGDIDGDVNFANLETVVTDRKDLRPDPKRGRIAFHFKSHPAGVRQLAGVGFNLFSLANNHTMDYGQAGLRETLRHMTALGRDNTIAFAGAGENLDAATRAATLKVKDATVAFGAIGIVSGGLPRYHAGPNRPGQAAFHQPQHVAAVLKNLAAARADYRILSSHHGAEGLLSPNKKQIRIYRTQAVGKQGIDLVVGHHAHVVQPVERIGDAIIFHGLGNFLHHGAADMSRFGFCRDYGLLAKVHLARMSDGTLRPRAIQAIPVTKMHIRTTRFAKPAESHKRIQVLNYLARLVDDRVSGAKGVRFTPQPDGSGLYCFPGAASDPGATGALCRGWQPAAAIPKKDLSRLARACVPRVFYRKRDGGGPGFSSWFRDDG